MSFTERVKRLLPLPRRSRTWQGRMPVWKRSMAVTSNSRVGSRKTAGLSLMTEIAERSLRLGVHAQVSSWGSYPTCRIHH